MKENKQTDSGMLPPYLARQLSEDNSSRRDPERPLFRDSAGGMILNKFVGEMNESKCNGRL